MAGCVGVAGSARIGAHCTVGGAGMILGHLDIADHVHISAASMVARSITKPGQYTGFFPRSDAPASGVCGRHRPVVPKANSAAGKTTAALPYATDPAALRDCVSAQTNKLANTPTAPPKQLIE